MLARKCSKELTKTSIWIYNKAENKAQLLLCLVLLCGVYFIKIDIYVEIRCKRKKPVLVIQINGGTVGTALAAVRKLFVERAALATSLTVNQNLRQFVGKPPTFILFKNIFFQQRSRLHLGIPP